MIQQPVHWSLFEQFVTGSFWGSFVGLSGLHMLCYFWWFVRGVLSMTPIGPQIKTQITVDMDIEHSPHKCCCRHHHSQYQLGVYGSVLSGQIQMMVSNSTQQIILKRYISKKIFLRQHVLKFTTPPIFTHETYNKYLWISVLTQFLTLQPLTCGPNVERFIR